MFKAYDFWHHDFIFEFCKITKPELFIELGVEWGTLTRRLVPVCGKVIGVDIRKPDDCSGFEFVQSTTQEFLDTAWAKGVLADIIFIDADHSKEQVLKDFEGALNILADDGIIFMHDSYPDSEECTLPRASGDCYLTIWELSNRKDSGFELCTIPMSPGLTIVRKRTKQVHWMPDVK